MIPRRRTTERSGSRRDGSQPHATAFALLLATTLVALATVPAAAQGLRAEGLDPVKVISLEARVTWLDSGRQQNFQIQPAEHVPLTVGERVRVDLVGTLIVDGRGVERPVRADFEVAAGDWRIDAAPAQGDAVTVTAVQPNEVTRGGAPEDSRSQLRYTVTGDYDLRQALREGRITFDISPRPGAEPGESTAPEDERWQHAERVADALSQVLLDEAREIDDALVRRIYRNGQDGAEEVATALALEAERRGYLRDWTPQQVVGHLYRYLVGRQGSYRDIAERDPSGFQANLDRLDRSGYRELVRAFVESQEFRRVHDLERLEELPVDPGEGDPVRSDPWRDRDATDTRPRGL